MIKRELYKGYFTQMDMSKWQCPTCNSGSLQAIQDMLANKERISVPKLMKKTGLSRGFFYKNPTVRDTLNQAVEQQAGMIDPRREILNMAMEKQIELLNQKVAALSRENKELKRKNEKLQKALRKQDLNFIKNL